MAFHTLVPTGCAKYCTLLRKKSVTLISREQLEIMKQQVCITRSNICITFFLLSQEVLVLVGGKQLLYWEMQMKINSSQGSVEILKRLYAGSSTCNCKEHEIGLICQSCKLKTLCEQHLNEPMFLRFISAVLQVFGKASWYEHSHWCCVTVVKAFKDFVHDSAFLWQVLCKQKLKNEGFINIGLDCRHLCRMCSTNCILTFSFSMLQFNQI